jgi:hypothetical protein
MISRGKNMNSTISLNDHNERIEYVGDIILNLDYWDCECEHNYIHHIIQQKCDICGSDQEECPSSIENEVQTHFRSLKN